MDAIIGTWLVEIGPVLFVKPKYRMVAAVIVLAMGATVFNEKPSKGFVQPKSRDHPTRIDATIALM